MAIAADMVAAKTAHHAAVDIRGGAMHAATQAADTNREDRPKDSRAEAGSKRAVKVKVSHELATLKIVAFVAVTTRPRPTRDRRAKVGLRATGVVPVAARIVARATRVMIAIRLAKVSRADVRAATRMRDRTLDSAAVSKIAADRRAGARVARAARRPAKDVGVRVARRADEAPQAAAAQPQGQNRVLVDA
jgi:hypothetical protein